MTANAPNILIVMADQMAPAFLPIYGHPRPSWRCSVRSVAEAGVCVRTNQAPTKMG